MGHGRAAVVPMSTLKVKLREELLERDKSWARREGASESWANAVPLRLQMELSLNEGGRERWRKAEPDGYGY